MHTFPVGGVQNFLGICITYTVNNPWGVIEQLFGVFEWHLLYYSL